MPAIFVMQKAHDPESKKKGSVIARELGLLVTASLVIALDQVSKFLVRDNMTLGQSIPEEGFFRITHITNAGGSWGILVNTTFLTIATVVVVVAAVVLYLRYPLVRRTPVRVAMGLLIGGAIGNIIDRLSQGHVTDFIDVGAWPVFNVADCAIVIGVIIIALYLIFSARKERRPAKPKDD